MKLVLTPWKVCRWGTDGTISWRYLRKKKNKVLFTVDIQFVSLNLRLADCKSYFKYITNGSHLTENSTYHNQKQNKSFAPWLAAFILFNKKKTVYLLEARTKTIFFYFLSEKYNLTRCTSTLAITRKKKKKKKTNPLLYIQ